MTDPSPPTDAPLINSLLCPTLPKAGSNQPIYWTHLVGASLSMALAQAAQQQARPLLVVCPDMQQCLRLTETLSFLLADTGLSVLTFPDWETLPYDHFSPHQNLISDRLRCLNRLANLDQGIVLTALPSLMHRLMPRQHLLQHSLVLKVGDKLNLNTLRNNLVQAAYYANSQVTEPGEFAIRGGILDLYPTGTALPLRIELCDDEIDTIRTFDPETQRSCERLTHFELLPAREFPLTDDAIGLFRQNWRDHFSGNPLQCPTYESISEGRLIGGIEYYLPLFHASTSCFIDHLPTDTVVVRLPELGKAGEQFWSEIEHRYEQQRHDITRPLLPPQTLFIPPNGLFSALGKFATIHVKPHCETLKNTDKDFHTDSLPNLNYDSKASQPAKDLQSYWAEQAGKVMLLATQSPGRLEVVVELLRACELPVKQLAHWPTHTAWNNLTGQINCLVAPFEQGFNLSDPGFSLITENELFGKREHARRQANKPKALDPDLLIRSLAELQLDAPIVHIEHGVGRYPRLGYLERQWRDQ